MPVESAPGGVEPIFRSHLNRAITDGVRTAGDTGLGVGTCHAIDLVATNHPEADVRLITDAYDAFAREHGAVVETSVDPEPVAKSLEPQPHPLSRKRRFRVR